MKTCYNNFNVLAKLCLFLSLIIGPFCSADDLDTLSDGLVLHFSFDLIEDGPATIIYDESGYDNHGVLLEGSLSEGRQGDALGCQAIYQSHGVRVRDHDSLDLDEVTIAAWIKTNQIDGQWNRILDKGWDTAYNLCIGGDYKKETWYRDRATFEIANQSMSSHNSVTDGAWHFIAATFDSLTARIYIDGALDSERTFGTQVRLSHNDVDLMIGRLAVPEPRPYANAFFDGLIDEIRLYNRALDSNEISLLYDMFDN